MIDDVLNNVQPKILNYLETQISGKFLVGNTMTLADIAIVSNFVVYQYIGYRLDAAKHPKLVKYIRDIAATDAYRKALDDEKPFVANMGLDRSFLDSLVQLGGVMSVKTTEVVPAGDYAFGALANPDWPARLSCGDTAREFARIRHPHQMRSRADIETASSRSVSQKRRSTDESDRGSAL